MASYTYSKVTNFGGNLKEDQLRDEINNDGGITPTCTFINTDGDVVTINFSVSLSTGEETTINSIISAHTPIVIYKSQSSYSFSSGSIIDTIYSSILTFIYPGSNQITDLGIINVTSYMDSGGTSYQIRLFDVTNTNVLASGSFTNTTININSLTSIANIPTDQAVCEVQIKVTGSTVAYASSLTLVYN